MDVEVVRVPFGLDTFLAVADRTHSRSRQIVFQDSRTSSLAEESFAYCGCSAQLQFKSFDSSRGGNDILSSIMMRDRGKSCVYDIRFKASDCVKTILWGFPGSCLGVYLVLPPPISWPNRYPEIFSHSIFCRVMGNCLRRPLNAPSLRLRKPRLSSSWYFFSTTAISFTIAAADEEDTDWWTGLSVKSLTLPSS